MRTSCRHRRGDFRDRRRCQGTEGETGDSGRRLITSEPIQDSGEGGQRGAHVGGVARVVQVADALSIGRPKALDEKKTALAQRMHASGESASTIAAALGVSRATVYRVLAEQSA